MVPQLSEPWHAGGNNGKRSRQRDMQPPARAMSAGQHSSRDPQVNPELSGGGGGVTTGGEEVESVVEKRLKQNREAARRSRDRKRQLKEYLRDRIPVLQEEHATLTDQVHELMKHLWVCSSSLPLHILLFERESSLFISLKDTEGRNSNRTACLSHVHLKEVAHQQQCLGCAKNLREQHTSPL